MLVVAGVAVFVGARAGDCGDFLEDGDEEGAQGGEGAEDEDEPVFCPGPDEEG